MDYEVVLDKTYLSEKKYLYGTVVAFAIVALCMLFSQVYWNDFLQIKSLLKATPNNVFNQNEYWRLITTTFVHADLQHLLSNSFMLFILTYFVTTYYGLAVGAVLSILMGGVTNFFVLHSFDSMEISLVGISGVVYYLWGFWFSLYLFIEKKYTPVRRFLNVASIFFILLVPTTYSPRTSYLAHYLGFSIGFLVGLIYYPIKAKFFKSFLQYKVNIVPELEDTDEAID